MLVEDPAVSALGHDQLAHDVVDYEDIERIAEPSLSLFVILLPSVLVAPCGWS